MLDEHDRRELVGVRQHDVAWIRDRSRWRRIDGWLTAVRVWLPNRHGAGVNVR
jgi:hypothetical protein